MVYSLDVVGSHLFPQTPHAVGVVSPGVSAATRPGVLRGRWHHLDHGRGLLQGVGSRWGPCRGRGLPHRSGRVRHLHREQYLNNIHTSVKIQATMGWQDLLRWVGGWGIFKYFLRNIYQKGNKICVDSIIIIFYTS